MEHFPRYWPFVLGIHRSPMNSPHKGQCRGAFMFSLICAWINGWVNNGEAGNLRRHRTYHDIPVMETAWFVMLRHVIPYIENDVWTWEANELFIRAEKVHDDVIKRKHFPRYWPFVRRIHRSPVNSPHKSQWRGAFVFSLICAWINGWVNNHEAGNLRRNRTHYDVIVMETAWFVMLHHVISCI